MRHTRGARGRRRRQCHRGGHKGRRTVTVRPGRGQVHIKGTKTQLKSDIAPIRESGATKVIHEDQDPVVVKPLGAPEGPSKAPIINEPQLLPQLLHQSEELYPGLQKKPSGRVDRAQSLRREVNEAVRRTSGRRHKWPWWRILPTKTSATSTAHRVANIIR